MSLATSSLELQLESKLNDAWIVNRLSDYAETRGGIDVLHSAAATGQEELRVVEQVEKLSAELQAHTLAEGQG